MIIDIRAIPEGLQNAFENITLVGKTHRELANLKIRIASLQGRIDENQQRRIGIAVENLELALQKAERKYPKRMNADAPEDLQGRLILVLQKIKAAFTFNESSNQLINGEDEYFSFNENSGQWISGDELLVDVEVALNELKAAAYEIEGILRRQKIHEVIAKIKSVFSRSRHSN